LEIFKKFGVPRPISERITIEIEKKKKQAFLRSIHSLNQAFSVQAKWEKIALDVTNGIPAQHLYKKVGFELGRDYSFLNWNRVSF
jgi:hypothetical protein